MSPPNLFQHYGYSTYIYRLIDRQTRPPILLQRNIRQVVDGHEWASATLNAKQAGRQPVSIMRKRRPTAFQLPDEVPFKVALEACPPARLRILLRAFEELDVKYPNDEDGDEIKVTDPRWLPDLDKFPITCSIECISHAAGKRTQTHFRESRTGTLVKKRHRDGQACFVFDLKPFYIDAETLYAKKRSPKSKANSRRTNAEFAANILNISIIFHCIEDAEEFESQTSTMKTSAPLNSFELQASYQKLPECPANGLIGSHCARNGEQYGLPGWGLRVDMAWSEANDQTALQIFNRAASEGSDSAGPGITIKQQYYRITYMFTGSSLETRHTTKDDLACLFCPTKRPYSSFDSLHFHYATHHAHFSFKVSDGSQSKEPQPDHEVIKKIIRIDLTEPQLGRAGDRALDDQEMNWVRPKRPLELKKYLNEDDQSWVNEGMTDSIKVQTRLSQKLSPIRAQSAPVDKQSPTPTAKRTACEDTDVPKRPAKRKKTFKVPKVSGVTFFRTTSKRVIHTGEELEESDEDVDDSWLQLLQTKPRKSPQCNVVKHINNGINHASPNLRNGRCLCGKACTAARGTIYCANNQCSRNEFHLKCVGLSRRVPDWQCPDCQPPAATTSFRAPTAVM
ncbi:hypothetical protein BDV97DRAFT_387890 [Delphinella strobiligena]|nr:hypothetical protein BDV97DRAFT_387890 [Delphinella strobiligena]